MHFILQDLFQARLEEASSQSESTPGTQAPDNSQMNKIWREVAGGVSRGRVYGTADLSANVRHHSATLTQESATPSSSRPGPSDQAFASLLEEHAKSRAEAAMANERARLAEESAAKAREDAARANQRMDEFLARFSSFHQTPAPSARPSDPPPAAPLHPDYQYDYDADYSPVIDTVPFPQQQDPDPDHFD